MVNLKLQSKNCNCLKTTLGETVTYTRNVQLASVSSSLIGLMHDTSLLFICLHYFWAHICKIVCWNYLMQVVWLLLICNLGKEWQGTLCLGPFLRIEFLLQETSGGHREIKWKTCRDDITADVWEEFYQQNRHQIQSDLWTESYS